MRQITPALLVLLASAMIALPIAFRRSASSSPCSIAEAIEIAEKKGLAWTTSPVGKATRRIIISDRPLDEEEAALVSVAIPRPGTVSCYLAWNCATVHYDPMNSAFWGKMFLHGDPVVIEALTGSSSCER